jgi:hypothetical protein
MWFFPLRNLRRLGPLLFLLGHNEAIHPRPLLVKPNPGVIRLIRLRAK